MHKLIIEYPGIFLSTERRGILHAHDVWCSKIKKSFSFLFLPRNLPPLVFANVIPLCFLVAFLLTENDLSKEKLYTQCATRFYDLIDGFSSSATRSTLRFTASCFFLFYSLFRYMFVYHQWDIPSLLKS